MKKIKKICFAIPSVIALALMICISVTVMGCSEEESSKKVGTTSESNDSNEKEEKSDNKETKSDNKEEKSEDSRYYPGDIVNKNDFEITYKKAEVYKSSNEYIKPSKGKKYVRFQFAFKNLGDDEQYIGSFECYYKNNKCKDAYVGEDDDSDFALESLSKGRSVSGSRYYEVPEKAELSQLELEYTSDLWSDEKLIFMGAK